MKNMVDIKLKP